MAITKLMHMKEAETLPSLHLKNSIEYILDVKNFGKKTDYGRWVGGNCGLHAGEVYQEFMNTKNDLNKLYGRQGYHFVISFPPDEADAQKAYDVAKEFCETYFGDNYEYVFAVHNDLEHKHAHIVFNSVSRTSGMKYRYENGDWEKTIQPITDAICVKHGLSKLEFEKDKPKNKSYAQFKFETGADIDWGFVMRADIDYAVEHADSMDEFYELMKEMSYNIRTVNSRKWGKHFAYTVVDEEGNKKHTRRSSNKILGERYSPDNIEKRIENKLAEKTNLFYEELADKLELRLQIKVGLNAAIKNTKTYYRAYQAVSFYRLPNPYAVPSYKIRKDIVHLDKLLEQCAYLKKNPGIDYEQRKEDVRKEIKILYKEMDYIKELEAANQEMELNEDIYRYRQLKALIADAKEWDDEIELAQDELEELSERIPAELIDAADKRSYVEKKIMVLRKEQKVLDGIIKNEKGEFSSLRPQIIKNKI